MEIIKKYYSKQQVFLPDPIFPLTTNMVLALGTANINKRKFNFLLMSNFCRNFEQILTIFQQGMDFDFQNELQTNQNQSEDGYYPEYCRLFLANIALTNQIKELIEQKNHLKYRLGKYEDQECYSSYERNQKAKRFRRNAHQIQRFYKCTIRTCGKSYGSEGSLNQHYKLKHPEIYASLPNVQSVFGQKAQECESQKIDSRIDYIRDSNSKVNSILKELGDIKSFKSMKIQELRFDNDQNKQNKQNRCHNIQQKHQTKINMTSTKQFMSLLKKDESLLTDDGKLGLKRSSRTIKKRDFHF